MDIKFYKITDDYGYLSNFAKYPIYVSGFIWPTVEHYFQANKFSDYKLQDMIRLFPTAMQAADEGRNRALPIRSDWEEIKVDVMRKAIKAKFFQFPGLKNNLQKTGSCKIIEHTTNDAFWGDGGGNGKNMLGILLSEVRDLLNSIDPSIEQILPPWVAFEGIDPADMFWRMGIGEGYLNDWYAWLDKYPFEDKLKYMELFKSNDEWQEIDVQ